MDLVDRISARTSRALGRRSRSDAVLSLEDWESFFAFGGPAAPFVQTTMGSLNREKVALSAVAAYKTSGPIFSLVLARMQVFSQVRFQWTRFSGALPGDLFGTSELGVLETPWPGGTTSDLLARMEMHNSLAGNAYVRRTSPTRLNVLRPDLVTIILGSMENEENPALAADTEVAGYFYTPAGGRAQVFLPDEVAHYAPVPDPWFHFLGQSWITPVVRELQGDQASVEHKWQYFVNGATVNLAVKFDPGLTIEKVRQFKALMEEGHTGIRNAFRTLYLGGGADVTPVGSNLKEMDYAVIQGRAEARLAAAAGVPPSWVGFSEGLQGSALNAGNFDSARKRFADGTMAHLWGNAASSLEPIVTPPQGASLWYDNRVPFMRQDAGELAGIQQQQANTITALIRDGFTPESAVNAVASNDWSVLEHQGLISVQLWKPGDDSAGHPGSGDSPSAPAGAPVPAVAPLDSGAPGPAKDDGSTASTPGPVKPAGTRAIGGYPQPVSAGSGMISLDLPPGTINPVPGGTADHHVTLIFLGADVDDTAFAQACTRALQAAGDAPGPLTGTAGGDVRTFKPSASSDGKVPVWTPAVIPGAASVRDGLADLSASEHPGWVPHITLGYADPGDDLPPAPPAVPVTFTHLAVHRGDDVMRFPLGGPAAATATSNGRVPAAAS